MADPERIRIRCSERTRRKWREATGAFDMSYGEFAEHAAKFALENRNDFERFIIEEERKRPKRDDSR